MLSTVGSVQYSGVVPSVRRRDILSTIIVFSTVEGYLQYRNGIQQRGVTPSLRQRDIISTVEGCL